MNTYFLFFLLLFCFVVPAQAALPKACIKYQAALQKNQSQLRAGYKEPKGNQLREKRR